MPRFLAVDWDDFECRYLFANVQRGSLKILKAGCIDGLGRTEMPGSTEIRLDKADEEDENDVPNAIAETSASPSASDRLSSWMALLRTEMREQKIESCPTLLCLGRNKVEMLYQTIPPSRESEVPVLLKNQILRELPSYSDFDPLDYLLLRGGENESQSLLALTIPLSYRQALVRTFRSAGRPLRHIGFRAAATAELLLQSDLVQDDSEPTLIVDAVGPDVDLIVLEGRRIASIRSFRLPDHLPLSGGGDRIADEVGRTVMVGVEGLDGYPIRKIVLFGSEAEYAELKSRLVSMDLDVHVVQPFEFPWIENEIEIAQPGRFAPLLGILSDQIPAKKTEMLAYRVDFLHPKEAPKPTNIIRAVFLSVVLLVIVATGLYFWNRSVIRNMEEDLAKLQKEYKEVSDQYRQIQPIWNVLRQTNYWDSQNVAWLDELRALSVSLPGEQDLVVSQISFTIGGTNPRVAGAIQLSGMIRDPSVLQTFQRGLNTGGAYQMRNPDLSRNPAGGGYPWLFRTTITKRR